MNYYYPFTISLVLSLFALNVLAYGIWVCFQVPKYWRLPTVVLMPAAIAIFLMFIQQCLHPDIYDGYTSMMRFIVLFFIFLNVYTKYSSVKRFSKLTTDELEHLKKQVIKIVG